MRKINSFWANLNTWTMNVCNYTLKAIQPFKGIECDGSLGFCSEKGNFSIWVETSSDDENGKLLKNEWLKFYSICVCVCVWVRLDFIFENFAKWFFNCECMPNQKYFENRLELFWRSCISFNSLIVMMFKMDYVEFNDNNTYMMMGVSVSAPVIGIMTIWSWKLKAKFSPKMMKC